MRKKDGSIRLCGDYRSTVNAVAQAASYPLPTVTEVLAKLRGGRIFSTIDLTQAYQQLKVTDDTAKTLTINTVKGLYRVNRLPFGVSAAPAIFQRCMDTTLAGISGISAYLDDIIVAGSTQEEHNHRLGIVLSRLENIGLRANRKKCFFGVPEVTFLGFKINSAGIHPTDDKLKAIRDLPEPTSKTTLQSFLGMLAFYDRFLENRATVAKDLYTLLEKNRPWSWEAPHKTAFRKLKELILQRTTLVHYDESRPLLLSCDASPYGVGAVLAQLDSAGREAPIAFASRTLGDAERNYSQLDKEGLAIIYGAIHFHQYIAGRHIIIATDHQPLLGILGPQKPVPQVLSPRMMRWCVKLAAYDYELVYRPGRRHQNADALSRLPLHDREDEPCPPGDVLMIEALPVSPLTAKRIAKMTLQDPTLSHIFKALQQGTLDRLRGEEFAPYKKKVTELSTQRGCVIWGSRVVIPTQARTEAMDLLHAGHKGIVSMKTSARSYLWWPAIDKDIEHAVEACRICQESRRIPMRAALPNWEHASQPWHTIHLDFAGPMEGHMFLVVVDSYTKWLEVRAMTSATSTAVIRELRAIFATFGLPRKVVSDNGSVFVSREVLDFYQRNSVEPVTSAPYHPATNGQAERMVFELKQALQKDKVGSLLVRLARFLYKQHTTVTSSTGKTPALLMFGRELASNISRVTPEPETCNKGESEEGREVTTPSRRFVEGQPVFAINFRGKPRWLEGTLLKQLGLRSWLLQTPFGEIRRHVDHIRRRLSGVTPPTSGPHSLLARGLCETMPPAPWFTAAAAEASPATPTVAAEEPPARLPAQHPTVAAEELPPLLPVQSPEGAAPDVPVQVDRRTSSRARRPPSRYGHSI